MEGTQFVQQRANLAPLAALLSLLALLVVLLVLIIRRTVLRHRIRKCWLADKETKTRLNFHFFCSSFT